MKVVCTRVDTMGSMPKARAGHDCNQSAAVAYCVKACEMYSTERIRNSEQRAMVRTG